LKEGFMLKKMHFYDREAPDVVAETLAGSKTESAGWMRHSFGADAPQCHEVHMPPGFRTTIHAHLEDEIVYVVGGELIMGQRTLGPGSSVYIPGNTLYSFIAGQNGVSFINFRPRGDQTQFNRDEFATLQTLQGADREAFIQANAAANRARYGLD
jgi:quercetin dioxygenase-like cupin family protein